MSKIRHHYIVKTVSGKTNLQDLLNSMRVDHYLPAWVIPHLSTTVLVVFEDMTNSEQVQDALSVLEEWQMEELR